MYRAMYERKYKRSADGTTDDDLAQFIWQYVSVNPNRPLFLNELIAR